MTHTVHTTQIRNIFIAALFVMIAFFVFTSNAFASTNSGSGTVGGDSGHEMNSNKSGGGLLGKGEGKNTVQSLEARLKSIMGMKAQLEELLARVKNGSSTPHSNGPRGTSTDDRKCKSGPNASSTASRPCDMRGENRATSTLKVVNPNGGERVVNEKKKGIVILWKAPKGMTTVDIDLMKEGSSTVSIAKAVKATRGNAIGNNKGKRGAGSYLWKDAPVGTGYKIVVTGKVGDTTYTDSSDKAFSIVAKRTGNDDEDEDDSN